MRMTGKRCFVISPIGPAGSETREHADDVFEFIIKPAMDELGIHVYRSDHSQEIGRVTEQMFKSILDDDLCIAVLTFFNPNVFYELAVAQCAARPVIILIQKGLTIPFDVHDLRAVEYDLRPRPLRDRVYVKHIVDLVRSLEDVGWTVPVPFGRDLAPLGTKQAELTLHDKLEHYGTSDRWISLLRNTATSFDLSGLSLRWWTKLVEFRPLLLQKARDGCKIRCLLNPSLPRIYHHERLDGQNRMAAEFQEAFSWFSQIAAACPNFEVRQVRVGCLAQQVVRSDTVLLVALPLYSRGPTSQFPLLECSASSPLFQAIAEEFDSLWALNGPEGATPTIAPSDALQSPGPA
jgi:hypothetical protein